MSQVFKGQTQLWGRVRLCKEEAEVSGRRDK